MGLKIQKNQKIILLLSSSVIMITAVVSAAVFLTYGTEETVEAAQQSYVVTNVNDSGPGSLRQAMEDANANATTSAAPHQISFNIAGGGVHTIDVQTALPTLVQPVEIDGTTQPGSACGNLVPSMPSASNTPHTLNIEITSENGAGARIFDIGSAAPNSMIRGLVLNGMHASFDSIISTTAADTEVSCNYLGVEPDGTTPNDQGAWAAIIVGAGADDSVISQNVIAGMGQKATVLLSGNNGVELSQNMIGATVNGNALLRSTAIRSNGLEVSNVDNASIHDNVIVGYDGGSNNALLTGGSISQTEIYANSVGVGLDGITSLPSYNGISLMGQLDGLTLGGAGSSKRNIIASNVQYEIGITETTITDLKIQGNYIGMAADGTDPGGYNGTKGISILSNTSVDGRLLIGGQNTGEGNYFGYNNTGLELGANVSGQFHIYGNSFGFKPDGTAAPNSLSIVGGYNISNGGEIRIGGPSAGQGNVIGNTAGHGIAIYNTTQNGSAYIQGNRVGIDRNGDPAPNNDRGIAMENVSHILVGGTGLGEANIVAKNAVGGIQLASSGTGVTIRGNEVYDNGRNGIDINQYWYSGSVANDDQDGDTGPNNFQNHPFSTSIESCDASAIGPVRKLNSTPNTTFTIDFYTNPSWSTNSANRIQGEQWHSFTTLTTDGSGDANLTIPSGIANPSFTATAPDGSTSEFGYVSNVSFADCNMEFTTSESAVSYVYGNWTANDLPYSDSYGNDGTFELTSLMVDGQPYDMTSGGWSLNSNGFSANGIPAGQLAEGSHDVTVTVTHKSSGLSMTHTFVDGLTVDTSPPPTPTVNQLRTNDTTPTLTGTAPGARFVYLQVCTPDDSTCIALYDAGLDTDTGAWTFDGTEENYTEEVYNPETDEYEDVFHTLAEGTYNVKVYAYDELYNSSQDTTTDELIVDLTEPAGTITPVSARNASPEVTGTVNDPDATIDLTVNGQTYRGVNNQNSTWKLPAGTIDSITTAGTYSATVTFTDKAGNDATDPSNNELSIVILPSVGTVSQNDGRPIVNGTYDAVNSQRFRVSLNSVWYELGINPELTSSGNSWTLNLSNLSMPLAPGEYEIMAQSTALNGEVLDDESNSVLIVQIGAPSSGIGQTIDAGFISLLMTGLLLLAIGRKLAFSHRVYYH